MGSAAEMPEREASGVAIDSRKVKAGDIFFCLPGERVDGHDFAFAAAAKGAVCIVAGRDLPDLPVPVIRVEDSCAALGQLARCWRKRMAGTVVCITGTAGKTTLKEMLAPILARAGKCRATEGNFNNQIGLPLTILNADGDEKYLLLEAGISHAGDMEYLGDICQPDLAIILNAGEGHTEGLGAQGVAWHKTRLLDYLRPGGRALINADYPELVREAKKSGQRARYFGNSGAGADYGPWLGTKSGFVICRGGERLDFEFAAEPLPLAETLLACASAALELGICKEEIESGLKLASAPQHRFQLLRTQGYLVIDDSYNANPLSMRTSLTRASQEAAARNLPLVAILGEMGELGSGAQAAHAALGELLGQIRPLAVFWKGQWLEQISAGYKGRVTPLGEPGEFPQLLADQGVPDRAMLIFKGSRLNRLEDYLAALLAHQRGRRPDVL